MVRASNELVPSGFAACGSRLRCFWERFALLKHEEPQYRTQPLLSRHAVQNSWRWCGEARAAMRRAILDEKKSCESDSVLHEHALVGGRDDAGDA